MKKICLSLFVILLSTRLCWATEPLVAGTPEQLLGFAQHLFETGEYYRAITEYQRFIFLYPKHSDVSKARFQIGACYFAGEEWKDAAKIWLANLGHDMPSQVRQQTLYQLAATYYKLDRYSLCRKYIEELQQESLPPPLLLASQKLLVVTYLEQERWMEAAEVIKQMEAPYAKLLSEHMEQAKDLPVKSPGLAGGLSAILPGAGQLYAERPQDAFMSFLLNGLFIWGTIEAFQHDKTATGVVLLFFETGWYFGNIYSAVSSAHKYNLKAKNSFRHQTKDRLQFKLGLPEAGPLGLTLSYKF